MKNKTYMRKVGIGWFLLLLVIGCNAPQRSVGVPPQERAPDQVRKIEVTAYCHCGDCCNWRRDFLGRPVIASGPREGHPKEVGITAKGTRAAIGTIAANPKTFPYGTILFIPGYGYGKVQDTGGGLKPNQVDVYFKSHRVALEWGRQHLDAKIWYPPS